MKSSKYHLLIFLIPIFLIGCYEDFDNSDSERSIEQPDIIVDSKLTGTLIGEDNEEINDYVVTVDGEEFNINGNYFNISKEYIKQKNQHITLIKDGQNVGFANVTIVKEDINKYKFQIFPSQTSISNQENIVLSQDFSIIYNTSDFTSTNIELVSGFTNDQNLLNQIGVLGLDNQNEEVFLNAKVAFRIQPKSSLEELLTDKSLKLAYNIENLNSSKLALFYYDKNLSKWIYQIDLTTNIGEVSIDKLGYYKIADYTKAKYVEGEIQIEEKAISYQEFTLSENNIKKISTANGKWNAILPIESETEMILRNSCSEDFQRFTIDTNDENSIQNIDPNFNSQYCPINVKVLDCDGNEIEIPSLSMESNSNKEIYTFPETQVDAIIPLCENNFNTTVFNSEDGNTSGVSLPWDKTIEDELGILSDCEEFDKGFNYIEIEGVQKTFESFTSYYNGGKTFLTTEDNSIQIAFKGNEIGFHEENEVNIFINDQSFGTTGYSIDCLQSNEGCGITEFYVSHYSNDPNEFIRASFEGEIWAQRINPPQAGYFKIKGQIIIKN